MKDLIYGDKYVPVSDIACERKRADRDTDGVEFSIVSGEGFVWERLRITNSTGARSIGRPIGRYDTLNLCNVHLLSDDELDDAQNELAKELCSLVEELDIYPDKILVAGLGNEALTADSVGPKSALTVKQTRKSAAMQSTSDDCPCSEICTVAPSVCAKSGLESFEIIEAISNLVRPNLIIAVDSIATSSYKRLGRCIQLCDTGIAPGSGIGGRRLVLNKKNLGVPVIAIGAPTVINSRLLCETDGSKAPFDGEELFVSPKEIDAIAEAYAKIISGGINQAFGIL